MIIDEAAELDYEGNAGRASAVPKTEKHGRETPDDQRKAERQFMEQALNVNSQTEMGADEVPPRTEITKQKHLE